MPQYTDAILITLFIVILILIVALIISLLAPADTSEPDTVPSRRPRGFFSTQLGLIILLVLAALLLSRISAIPATQRPLSEPFSLLNLLKPLPWPEIILSALVLVALFGIYPLSYLAYKLVVSKSQQKRLQDDLILLGYPEAAVQNAKDLFNITYSTKQYNGYILLILLISSLVVLGFIYPNRLSITGVDSTVLSLVFYAYLGAYVFSVQELIRRYNTEDLRPQVYSSILVRILVALVVTFVGAKILLATGANLSAGNDNQAAGVAQTLTQASADLAASGNEQAAQITGNIAQAAEQAAENSPEADPGPAAWAAILAFLIGIFPKSGIDWFQKLAKNTLTTPEEVNVLPVRNIQGISTWHESRLAELGIDDVQNLATVDILKMLLTTRFDTQEIINWIDQAILYAKVRDKYPRFKEASISTFHEFRIRLNLIDQNSATKDSERKNLATRISLTEQDLDYLAQYSDYPNYAYISQYYRHTIGLAIERAQAGMEGLAGLREGAQVDENQKQQQFESEAEKYRVELEQNWNDVDALVNYGAVLIKLQRFDEARQKLESAINLDPQEQKASSNLALVYLKLNEWDKAQTYATRAIDLDHKDKHAYNYRGLAFTKLGGFEHAIQDFNQALQLSEHYADVYLNRGIAYNTLGDFASALSDFYLAYYLLADHNLFDLWLGWGTAYLGVGDQKEQQQPRSGVTDYGYAIDKLTHAIAYSPLAECYAKRGYALMQRNQPGDYENAEQDFLTALTFNPETDSAHHNLGLLMARTNRLETAIQEYQKAIEIKERKGDPSLIHTQYNLALAYWKTGSFAEACQEFQHVLDKAAGSPGVVLLAQQAARYLASPSCSGPDSGADPQPIEQPAPVQESDEQLTNGSDGQEIGVEPAIVPVESPPGGSIPNEVVKLS